jgi:E3 ubiquitin-protein ligase HUWE1
LVSRRVLEILTHLSKHHGAGADLLTHLKLFKNRSTIEEKGKSKLIDESCSNLSNGEVPLVVLLQLLNQPLYSRSSAHLEQVFSLCNRFLQSVKLCGMVHG